jgi:hypothetical protein
MRIAIAAYSLAKRSSPVTFVPIFGAHTAIMWPARSPWRTENRHHQRPHSPLVKRCPRDLSRRLSGEPGAPRAGSSPGSSPLARRHVEARLQSEVAGRAFRYHLSCS